MSNKELSPDDLTKLINSTFRFFKGPNIEFRKRLAVQAIDSLIDQYGCDTKRIFQEIASGKGKPSTHASAYVDTEVLKTATTPSVHRPVVHRNRSRGCKVNPWGLD